MKLVDVIGAWIAKRHSPNKQRNEGELVGFTLFTFAKAGNRKLSEARVTFECDDISVCEEWIEKINDTLQVRLVWVLHLIGWKNQRRF